MKKLLSALTALLCVSAVFTGCGKTDDSSESEKSSSKASEDDLKDVVQDMIDAVNGKDIEKLLACTAPDDLSESLIDLLGDDLDALMESEDVDVSDTVPDVKLISVEKTEDMDEDYQILIEKLFSFAETFTDYMEENDMSLEDFYTMDEDELMETPLGELSKLMEEADYESAEELVDSGILDEIKTTVEIEGGCMAEVTIESDGEEETIEMPFYKIKGEGWNCDMILYPSMLGYVKKSKQTAADSSARSLYSAVNTALTECDEEGIDILGTYIIGSEDKYTYEFNDKFDMDEFKLSLREYFNDADEYDYFFFIKDGTCIYAACVKKDEDSDYVGTYPAKALPAEAQTGEKSNEDGDYSLDALFGMAKKDVR